MKVYKSRCTDCKYYLLFADTAPQKIQGLLLQAGQRYCLGGKRIRQFKANDPKIYLPSWCPRLKNPAILRIYCLKDAQSFLLSYIFNSNNDKLTPSHHRYILRYVRISPLSAPNLVEQAKVKPVSDLLGLTVNSDEVIEIDDGIKAYCFWVNEKGIKLLPLFDSGKVCKNGLQTGN